MKQNKDKQIRDLNQCIAIIALVLLLVMGLYLFEFFKGRGLEQELQSCQDKVPIELDYKYNHTKCVFDYDGDTVVCSLLMRESCSEIKHIDQNCEVIE